MNHPSHQLVKRFVAPTMSRALEMVQRELGPEAVILSSKRIDKGVEIVTSLEPDLPTRGIDVRRDFGRKFDADLDTAFDSDSAWRASAGIEQAAANYGGAVTQRDSDNYGSTHYGSANNGSADSFSKKPFRGKSSAQLAQEIEQAREKMLAAKRQAKQAAEAKQHHHQQSDAELARELKDFYGDRKSSARQKAHAGSYEGARQTSAEDKAQLESLQSELADMRMLLEQQLWRMGESQAMQSGSATGLGQQINMPNKIHVVAEHLSRLGLTENVQQELLAGVAPTQRASAAWRECMAHLSQRVPICDEGILEHSGVYAFFGQTGVGKTTTIAKLAAQYVMRHGPGRVALVTTDTYRVGAYEQLRSMGKILNVPVKVVDKENSLLTVLSSLRQFPLILIDTAGFRYGDPMLKKQLAQFDRCPMVQRVLVMSCNSQLANMKASIHAHTADHPLFGCVLTKLDESATLGEALSVVVEKQLPVAYTTDGQEIPQDIAPASGHGLVAKAVAAIKQKGEEYSATTEHASVY
ncbi:Flagellar biosynthesis protein FlhF [Thalassocella blandensis]|nr:Flagellar biosynthesis protein FlhF [Thalassocella blandensis]